MDAVTVAIIFGSIGGLTGISGLIISVRSDRRAERADRRAAGAEARAQRAEENSIKTKERELWTELIAAMLDCVNVNVLDSGLREKLARFRVAQTELYDGVSSPHYKKLGHYLELRYGFYCRLLDWAYECIQRKEEDYTSEDLREFHEEANRWLLDSISYARAMRHNEPGDDTQVFLNRQIEAIEPLVRDWDARGKIANEKQGTSSAPRPTGHE